jgi:hypothetical protein
MPAQQATIAEVLHVAADKFLAKDNDEARSPYMDGVKQKYSCHAIDQALRSLGHNYDGGPVFPFYSRQPFCNSVRQFVRSMGLDVHSMTVFGDDFEALPYEKRQQIRYAWLKFAAMYAEELGV